MAKLKIGILGASGFGKFHAREYKNLGHEVIAVLGKSKESSELAAKNLSELYRIETKPYSDLDEMLKNEKLDVVSVCSPAEFHARQTETCLNSGINVLCEKPFIQGNENNYTNAKKLFDLAKGKKLVLSVNTQLPAIFNYIKTKPSKRFEMLMETAFKGVSAIKDYMPHMNSLLLTIFSGGLVRNVSFSIKGDNNEIRFDYLNEFGTCKVKYNFKFKEDRPRDLRFLIGDKEYNRKIGRNYEQILAYDNKEIKMEDPLRTSIGRFCNAVLGLELPLITEDKALQNVLIQDQIINKYLKHI
jgi:hypothetical protein